MSSRALVVDLWAKNTGGDAGNSAQSVRAARAQDQAAGQARWSRVADAVTASESRTDDEITQGLLEALDI